MTAVYVPWTQNRGPYPECRKALEPSNPTYVDVSSDDFAYWRMMRDVWNKGEPFIIVEHDVLVRSDTIERLAACPRQWCSQRVHSVDVGHGRAWVAALGCAHFRPEGEYPIREPVSWKELDMATEDYLTLERFQKKHIHRSLLLTYQPSVLEYVRLIQFLRGT
jgi:hypothetical protein